jgi:putative Mg2+ transporter-C (MgtC) family protein
MIMWLEQALNYISSFNTASVVLRILLAVLFGSLTGLDRTRKRRPAGFRTYSLVCLGAALTMLVGQYIIYTLDIATDPARIGAQVVSGVGFLGAGTIMLKSKNQVKGLTTAAGLWASACLGLAIGIGFYLAAIVGLLAIIFIETLMHQLNDRLIKNANVMNIYLELLADQNLGNMITCLRSSDIQVADIESASSREGNVYSYLIVLRLARQCRLSHADIVQMINSSNGIVFCEELI